ncbi:MAG TPA: SNF2-related protein [Terrimicrobiaceae bacterium]
MACFLFFCHCGDVIWIVELSEKLLISMGGWQAFREAKILHSAGRVVEAVYEPPVLKGKLSEGGRQFLAGLKLRNSIDVENLCSCRDSRVRGIICAHSLAVGLQVIKPARLEQERSGPPPREQSSPLGQQMLSAPRVAASRPSRRQQTDEAPSVELALEGSLRHLEAEIHFRYSKPDVVNAPKEIEALTQLLECGFVEEEGKAVLRGEAAIVGFFASGLPKLKQTWQVREGERFQHVTRDFVRIDPQFAIRQRSDGWLDFHVHYTAGSSAVLSAADLNRLLQGGQSQFRLKDGRIAVANSAFVADLEEVLRDCNPRQERGGYHLPSRYLGYLKASIAQWKAPESTDVSDTSNDGLGAMKQKLRPYQVEGAAWLLQRAQRGEGALLADEMGLGKTVQALALIEALPGTTLVVCPSSLVWNWRREAHHFLPDLTVLSLDGPDRDKHFAEIPAHRLVITSYALLRRDIHRYKGSVFAAVILDEAQHIKNPESQNAKAACALVAQSRFILTGTPLENSLRDLWSLFEFLLPGYLGSREDFKDRYETPLLNGQHGEVWKRLSRRLRPFLMRRRKEEILSELPEKIEQVIEVELSPEQKAAYTELQSAARIQIDELRSQSSGASHMRVLTALLRLRQACCDLRLLGKNESSSSKLNALLELIEEAVDGGHRALVFSQFTAMLDIIEAALKDAAISFCRLDGSTTNRQEVVERFQNDERIPVFLISLKAGGVGLNLTAADTVIHFDPWWNPAVEAQATDRAHRIGQNRVVTSLKLIARDTVEERVLAMQEKKRELLEGIMNAESALSQFSVEDLRELVD